MAAKKTARKPARAKATRKTSVRTTRKAPAVVSRSGQILTPLGNMDTVGLP